MDRIVETITSYYIYSLGHPCCICCSLGCHHDVTPVMWHEERLWIFRVLQRGVRCLLCTGTSMFRGFKCSPHFNF